MYKGVSLSAARNGGIDSLMSLERTCGLDDRWMNFNSKVFTIIHNGAVSAAEQKSWLSHTEHLAF